MSYKRSDVCCAHDPFKGVMEGVPHSMSNAWHWSMCVLVIDDADGFTAILQYNI